MKSKHLAIDYDPGFSDELNYAFLVDDGIICCKDGSLGAGWIIEGDDSASWSPGEKTARVNRINDAFRCLGAGWSFWHEMVCDDTTEYADANADHFPDELTQRIDDERRQFFQGDEGTTLSRRIVFLLGYTPPSAITRKSVKLFFDDTLSEDNDDRDEAAKALDELRKFKAKIEEFETNLRGVIRFDRLADYEQDGDKCSDLVNYIDFRLGGASREVALTQDVVELDAVLNYD